jgi:hypothetical protein
VASRGAVGVGDVGGQRRGLVERAGTDEAPLLAPAVMAPERGLAVGRPREGGEAGADRRPLLPPAPQRRPPSGRVKGAPPSASILRLNPR